MSSRLETKALVYSTMASQPFSEDAVAAADKEMEERANRAKELLSRRYHGLKNQQVRHALSCGIVIVV